MSIANKLKQFSKLYLRIKRHIIVNSKPLPDFLIIGAQKSGTTYLYHQLHSHPDIFMPKQKELHFFDTSTQDIFFPRTKHLIHYSNYFKHALPWQKKGEATPSYLLEKNCPQRIFKIMPRVKLIILLRSPIERAYSQYRMMSYRKLISPGTSFLEVFRQNYRHIAARGFYSLQIQRYLRLFPKEQFYINTKDQLQTYPDKTLEEIYRFLEVAPCYRTTNYKEPYRWDYHTHTNISATISNKDRIILTDYYHDSILDLESLLNLDLSSWRKVSC